MTHFCMDCGCEHDGDDPLLCDVCRARQRAEAKRVSECRSCEHWDRKNLVPRGDPEWDDYAECLDPHTLITSDLFEVAESFYCRHWKQASGLTRATPRVPIRCARCGEPSDQGHIRDGGEASGKVEAT